MALPNGVLVHGPNSWACAIRHEDGQIEVASARKRFRATRVQNPLLRGPARLAEAILLLPQVKAKLPAARLPMESPRALMSMVGTAMFIKGLRESSLRPLARELLSAVASVMPAVLTLRSGELAAYHGAEHISIGSYEHGKRATREHERCGGHLVGPLIATTAVGNVSREPRAGAAPPPGAGSRAARRDRRGDRALRLDDTATRQHPLSKALSKPGHELQHRFSTAEPTADQLEVAEAALKACLELEHAAAA